MGFFFREMLQPAIHRLGSVTATALASYGVASADIQVITAGPVAAAGVLVDLVVRKVV